MSLLKKKSISNGIFHKFRLTGKQPEKDPNCYIS